MENNEKFHFKFTTGLPSEEMPDLMAGKFSPRIISSAASYILPNISNITLIFVPIQSVQRKLMNYAQVTQSKNVSFFTSLDIGLADTLLINGRPRSSTLESIHYCPGFLIEETVLITGNKPDANIGIRKFSFGAIEELLWGITLIALFLSVISPLFENFILTSRPRVCKILDYIWFYTSVIFLNGSKTFPRRLSTKFLLWGFYLATSILMRSLSGNLKSTLTVSSSFRINDFKDLVNSAGTIPLLQNSSFVDFLRKQRHQDPIIAALFKNFKYLNEYSPKMFGVYKNGTSKYAVLHGINMVQAMINNDPGFAFELRQMGVKVYLGKKVYHWEYSVFPFSKKLPKRILENVDYLTQRYVETAQSQRAIRVRDLSFARFKVNEGDHAIQLINSVCLQELSTPFYLWLFGLVLSFLALIVEILTGIKATTKGKRRRRKVLK